MCPLYSIRALFLLYDSSESLGGYVCVPNQFRGNFRGLPYVSNVILPRTQAGNLMSHDADIKVKKE